MAILPFTAAADLAPPAEDQGWLVEGLWGEAAVGILGGEPKCCKSFLALDLAVAVSSGCPCLGRFAVKRPGRVLLYAAEDSQHIIKTRLAGIASARGVALSDCDIQVITSARLRLDKPGDVQDLDETVAMLSPRLLILDPFVRLHCIDENSSADVAIVLQNLRAMQRQYKMAVLIVHHSKKNGGGARAGQALRGSSEFHAWGDSNLYVRRLGGDGLSLSIEQRAAASPPPISLALQERGDGTLALEIQSGAISVPPDCKSTPARRIEEALAQHDEPVSLASLREACGIRMVTMCETLKSLVQTGKVLRSSAGYALPAR